MYIAIEGIKGSGKTTIINELFKEKFSRRKDLDLFPITASMPLAHPLERAHHLNPKLRSDDGFLETLFRNRAYWNQQHQYNNSILGDRSILTSYVTRWNKWGDPYYTIKKTKYEYKGIIKPDVLIWIQTPIETAVMNINMRIEKSIGKNDERKVSLLTANDVYDELLRGGLYKRKINKIQHITLPNNAPSSQIANEIEKIIKYYKK